MTTYFILQKIFGKYVVDKTYYTDGSEPTYEEKDHLVSFIIDVETFNKNYETPPHHGQYVPLVHVLNYDNIHGNGMVRFFYYYHTSAYFPYILLKLHHIANYATIMIFNRKFGRIVCLIWCI